MLAYTPSVVAAAAVLNVLEEKAVLEENLGKVMNLFGKEHKVRIIICNIVSTNKTFWFTILRG